MRVPALLFALLLPLAAQAADTVPDPFSFADVPAAAPATQVVSAPITVSGIDARAAIGVSGTASARYSINGKAFRSASATVKNGDHVRLRLKSAPNAGVARIAKLTIGGVSDAWRVTTRSARWAGAYYPCYWRHTMAPSEIDYSALTQVIHWPALPKADGTLDLSCYDNQLDETHSADVVNRAHAVGTKALLGIGGDQGSGATAGFQGAASNAYRAAFVANVVGLVTGRHYDGVEINWEVIRAQDEANFQALMADLRAALDAAKPGLLLTFVPETQSDASAARSAAASTNLDQVNLQTYVMSGPYPGWITWFNSPLYNAGLEFPCCHGEQVPSIDVEVQRFIDAGVPAQKLAISSQFEGMVWAGGTGTDTGGVTKPRQSWNDCCPPSASFMRYADIVAQFTVANGYARIFDDVAKVPYLSHDVALPGNDRFVSYDDEQAIQEKAAYVKARGLGGYFAFELYGDYDPSGIGAAKHPLLQAIKTYVKEGFVQAP